MDPIKEVERLLKAAEDAAMRGDVSLGAQLITLADAWLRFARS